MKKLFIIILFALAYCSCSKDKKPVYINNDLKNYFNYQEGSYWIFYDSVTNNVDSLYVESYVDYKPYSFQMNPDEEIDIDMIDTSSTFYAGWKILLSGGVYADFTTSGVGSDLLVRNIPFQLVRINNTHDSGYYECLYLSDYAINSVLYKNVYRITIKEDSIGFLSTNKNHVYYINANNGFLEILLENTNFHKKLYLIKANIVR